MPNTELDKLREKFNKMFPCKEHNCDSNGNTCCQISEDECEQQQCQNCFENRMPIADWWIAQIAEMKQEMVKKCEGLQGSSEEIGRNEAIDEVIRIINE